LDILHFAVYCIFMFENQSIKHPATQNWR